MSDGNLIRVIGGVALVGLVAFYLGAHRLTEMRSAAVAAVIEEFQADAEPPAMRALTMCGARGGEVGQYFVTRVRPNGAPDGAYVNRALGIVYADWRHVTRVGSAGFASGFTFGTDSDLGCALPVAQRLAHESLADLCGQPGVREINQDVCARVQP